ncbi:hypothetical protein BTO02_16525 [Paraburkholderia sp. SOS3]|nr:hypothetical protein BTO02_16525 [Paraburkholderia sp. SOS3]
MVLLSDEFSVAAPSTRAQQCDRAARACPTAQHPLYPNMHDGRHRTNRGGTQSASCAPSRFVRIGKTPFVPQYAVARVARCSTVALPHPGCRTPLSYPDIAAALPCSNRHFIEEKP